METPREMVRITAPPAPRGKPQVQAVKRRPKIRTACYCRVSTALDSQQLSLESQMIGFQKKINENPNMILAGVYADEGITGTSAKLRKEFKRMIQDAYDGKIDCIMTKSISRFARNTVDCLDTVQKLKEIGVNVIFEKEKIDTADTMSEMLLTVLAAFAQEESRSISENLKWGIRKRYEMGIVRWSQTYGYTQDEDKNVIIDPDKAAVVEWIFDLYRRGNSVTQITERLNEARICAPKGGPWSASTVFQILGNERYVGDMILQKFITVDFKTHKSIRNPDLEKNPQYRVMNNHPPIIDRRLFEQVQRIAELRAPRGECSRYPYEDTKIICPYCGKPMVTRLMHVQSAKKAVCCFGEDGCHGFSVKTWMLEKALLDAYEAIKKEDIPGYSDGAKHMREMKEESPPETVEYYFLDDLVKQIRFIRHDGTRIQRHKKKPSEVVPDYSWDVIIEWSCGLTSTIPLPQNERNSEEPTHVAELYERYLQRIYTGEYIPTRPKNLRERKMKEEQRHVIRVAKGQ